MRQVVLINLLQQFLFFYFFSRHLKTIQSYGYNSVMSCYLHVPTPLLPSLQSSTIWLNNELIVSNFATFTGDLLLGNVMELGRGRFDITTKSSSFIYFYHRQLLKSFLVLPSSVIQLSYFFLRDFCVADRFNTISSLLF